VLAHGIRAGGSNESGWIEAGDRFDLVTPDHAFEVLERLVSRSLRSRSASTTSEFHAASSKRLLRLDRLGPASMYFLTARAS
jgi:hypothetical protein